MKRRFGRKKKSKLFWVFMMGILCFAGYIYMTIENNIKPTMLALSEIRARLIATEAISEAVSKKMLVNEFENLLITKTDNQGKITMIQANTSLMNKLAVETSLAIQREIENMGTSGLKIPLSNVFHSQLFANIGPRINIQIQPAGSVNVDFNTEFEEAGINQTRWRTYLIVKTNVQMVSPLAKDIIDVTTNIPVSETIIVSIVAEKNT